MALAYAGCRLSEALALIADRVDLAAGLKKTPDRHLSCRTRPPALLDALNLVHGIRELQSRRARDVANVCGRGRA